jgi:hypothetical protein
LERVNSIRGLAGVNVVILSEAKDLCTCSWHEDAQILRFAQDDTVDPEKTIRKTNARRSRMALARKRQ